jgi:uncharacterized protein (TIGR00730 family)
LLCHCVLLKFEFAKVILLVENWKFFTNFAAQKQNFMPNKINTITVYAASSCDAGKDYIELAEKLGKLLAERSIECVYGGGPNGLMGAVANSVLDNGGKVCGVIPRFMIERNWLNKRLTNIIETQTMHERKQIMADRSDACIALPGGLGTLDELFEIITWKQLGLYLNPIIILNFKGFYNDLLNQIRKITEENLMRHESGEVFSVAETPEEALQLIFEQVKSPIEPLE